MEQELEQWGVDSLKPQSLPPGWQAFLDPTHGVWFFVGPNGDTQWEHPDNVIFVASPPSMPKGWKNVFSEEHRCWYFKSSQEGSQWEHPEDGIIYKQPNRSQVVEVMSPPSCPAGWLCFYGSEYRCWYFVFRDGVRQWIHPQDGKTYKMRTLPAASSSASTSFQERLPMHSLTQELVHPIILISCGWNKYGGECLEKYEEKLWHRVDKVFNSYEHLDRWGIHSKAQDQFLRLYGNLAEQCLQRVSGDIAIQAGKHEFAHVFVCKSGHHRSVAFVELLRNELQKITKSPIVIRHLDIESSRHNFQWPDTKSFLQGLEAGLANSLLRPPAFLLHNLGHDQRIS